LLNRIWGCLLRRRQSDCGAYACTVCDPLYFSLRGTYDHAEYSPQLRAYCLSECFTDFDAKCGPEYGSQCRANGCAVNCAHSCAERGTFCDT
jgi:hypothetical protein